MGRPKDACWEHATEISDPNNPNKRKWRCNYCELDYAGGASRIKVHLGFEAGEGIHICKKYKRGQVADEALEQGNTSAGPHPLVADSGNTLPSLGQSNTISVLPQGATETIHRTIPPRHPELRDPYSISNQPISSAPTIHQVATDLQSFNLADHNAMIQGDTNANRTSLLVDMTRGYGVTGLSNAQGFTNDLSSSLDTNISDGRVNAKTRELHETLLDVPEIRSSEPDGLLHRTQIGWSANFQPNEGEVPDVVVAQRNTQHSAENFSQTSTNSNVSSFIRGLIISLDSEGRVPEANPTSPEIQSWELVRTQIGRSTDFQPDADSTPINIQPSTAGLDPSVEASGYGHSAPTMNDQPSLVGNANHATALSMEPELGNQQGISTCLESTHNEQPMRTLEVPTTEDNTGHYEPELVVEACEVTDNVPEQAPHCDPMGIRLQSFHQDSMLPVVEPMHIDTEAIDPSIRDIPSVQHVPSIPQPGFQLQDAILPGMPTLAESQVGSFLRGNLELLQNSHPDVQSRHYSNEVNDVGTSATSQSVTGSIGGVREPLLVKNLVGKEYMRIVNEIWDGLTKDNASPIGVYGMPGVGKSEAVRHLHNKACLGEAFCNVFWVTVSKGCTVKELQIKIAKATKAPLDVFKDEDEARWSTLLFNYLIKRKKSLLILDDAWQKYDLVDVGIPKMKDDIKLVVASRNGGVCDMMSCEKQMKVDPLFYEESWSLFMETIGNTELSPHQERIAGEIVRECGGLPLAIVVMAGSMKGVNSDYGWEDALEKLRQPLDLPEDMEKYVYRAFRHSYDSLNVKKQECLSLCAMYPEDWEISREELIELCMDEGLIRGESRWRMCNEGHQLLDELVKACLLEPIGPLTGSGRRVRMHDVIRDMTLYLSGGIPWMVISGLHLDHMPDEDEWRSNLRKVSLMRNDMKEIPSMSPDCPQLSALLLNHCWSLREISGCFFELLQGLTIIDLSFTAINQVPESIANLAKLSALILRGCKELIGLPSLGKLTSLRKLDLHGCRGLRELPNGLEELVKLTYLNLSETRIMMIPDGMIGKLLRLQYLDAGGATVKGEEIAKLNKLEFLSCRLRNVDELTDYARHKMTNIRSYIIFVDRDPRRIPGRLLAAKSHERAIFLQDECCKLLWDHQTTCRLEEVEELWLSNCWGVSALDHGYGSVSETESGGGRLRTLQQEEADVFPSLKKLGVDCSEELQHLMYGGSERCPLWLTKIKQLEIRDCYALESVINGVKAVAPEAFSQLVSIRIVNCPNMRNVVDPKLQETAQPPAPNACLQQQLLPLLTKIDMWGCHGMKRVLTLEVFMLLPNLQHVSVDSCGQMEEVIGQETIELETINNNRCANPSSSSTTTRRWPVSFKLQNLPELIRICCSSYASIRDFIKVLEIYNCPKLKRIHMLDGISSHPPLLERIVINFYEQWEAMEWDHPESKLAIEPAVFIRGVPINEWRRAHSHQTDSPFT